MPLPAVLGALGPAFDLIDDLFTSDEEKAEAKAKAMKLAQSGELKYLESASQIITAEASSQHPLTSQWRPITMLVFVALISAHWLGFTPENLPPEQVLALLEIVKLGLAGYVLGRSAEKGIEAWKK